MHRFALGFLLLPIACEGRLAQSHITALVHDEAGTGVEPAPGTHVIPPAECTGRCCPKSCPVPSRDGATYSGPECYAQYDNTGQKRWQLRQTMSVSVSPPGVRSATIANVLLWRSQFQSAGCGTPQGTSGFMQLIDFDREAGTSRVGFARYERNPDRALENGLCFVEDEYQDDAWAIPQVYDPVWPKGLPKPMVLPWKAGPILTKRVLRNFELPAEREELLARFAEDGDLHEYQGLFYMNEETGFLHGFAPMAFVINYDDATHYNAIPIRETELTMQANDPAHPNCIGSFLGDNPTLSQSCEGTPTDRTWGCYPGNCGAEELTPASVKGYFLAVETEQLHNQLDQTLCHLLPGPLGPPWDAAVSCRANQAVWNPMDPVKGIPPGDWCAATNDVATEKCHDAFRSVSYSTFQAFPIREETCPAK